MAGAFHFVTPADTGFQLLKAAMDSGIRRNEEGVAFMFVTPAQAGVQYVQANELRQDQG